MRIKVLHVHQFHTQVFIILNFTVMPQNILEFGSLIFFLTIITLSLYAPWAKVRRLRYFYGNTEFLNVVLILLVFQPRF